MRRLLTFMLLFVAVSVFCLIFAGTTLAVQGEGHKWTHGDWSARVLWEARYALSKSANGYSSSTTGTGIYQKWYGDWDYVANDTNAKNQAELEAYYVVGQVGPYNGHFRGGWCTFFVRLVLYRATYWYFNDHYTTPVYPKTVYTITDKMTKIPSQFKPGWVLLTPTNIHYAIAEKEKRSTA